MAFSFFSRILKPFLLHAKYIREFDDKYENGCVEFVCSGRSQMLLKLICIVPEGMTMFSRND